jgi:outer membrane protein TolC
MMRRIELKARRLSSAAALLVLAASSVTAQAPASSAGPAGVALADAIRTALARNAAVQQARYGLELRVGDILVAADPFDLQLASSITGVRDPGTPAALAPAGSPASRQLSYQVSLIKQFRFGLALRPELSVAQLDLQDTGVLGAGNAAVALHAILPLARDRWAETLRSTERAARVAHAAEELRVRHTAASAVLNVTAAYWNYRAAQHRLEVLTASEQRASRLVDEIGVLVKAEERPPSDLDQVRANLATKRIARLNAEQSVVAARWQLGVEIGLPSFQTAALPAASTDFPVPRAFDVQTSTPELLRTALAKRPDLAASMLDRRAAEVLLDGARGQARPRFDLTFSVGYEGSATGERWEPLFQPLYRNIPGVRASLQVDYQQPFANAAARGFALQRAALHEQQRVIEADLTLRVRSGIAVSSEALHSSARAADEAARAVELHRKTVDNERRKNQLGAATLLDVILAEDRWTSALLDEVATRLDFALALASLRFESGTMVAGERGTLDVNVDQLLKPF